MNAHIIHPIPAVAVVAFAALLAGSVGCRHYVNPGSVNFVSRGTATLYDLRTAEESLVQRMANDEGFRIAYGQKAAEKGGLPVLQMGNIDNLTDERVAQKLESLRRRLEIDLRKTRLFEITDDAASAESTSGILADSIVQNADLGLKGGDNVQHVGRHVSADYQMYGRYRKFHEGRRHTYELSLQLIDIATGKQVWSDLAEVAKE